MKYKKKPQFSWADIEDLSLTLMSANLDYFVDVGIDREPSSSKGHTEAILICIFFNTLLPKCIR